MIFNIPSKPKHSGVLCHQQNYISCTEAICCSVREQLGWASPFDAAAEEAPGNQGFRALFAIKNSQLYPENVSVYNQTPVRCIKRKEGWNFLVFVDLERLIVTYQREETCLFILLYKTCLIRSYSFSPKGKARIAAVWMMLQLGFTGRYQKFRQWPEKWQKHQGPGTCSGAVSWLLWLPPPGNQWRNHPGSQTWRHPETPGSHHLLVLPPDVKQHMNCYAVGSSNCHTARKQLGAVWLRGGKKEGKQSFNTRIISISTLFAPHPTQTHTGLQGARMSNRGTRLLPQ